MDKRHLFEAVKEVRELAKQAGILDVDEKKPGPGEKSQDQYWRIFERDWTSKEKPMEGVSRSSWFVHRAALTWGYREQYRDLMRKNDQAQKAGDVEEALLCVERAKRAVKRWIKVQEAQRPEKPDEPTPRRTKRAQMPKKRDWREQVQEAARPTEKAAIAVLWASGLRPEELEMGVDVRLLDGTLTIQIPGAKVSAATKGGQKWRVLEIDRASDVGKVLESALEGDTSMSVQMGRRVLEAALERLGEELKHRHRLSGYTFRHQLGADLKSWGDPELTAAVLGHQSERTQSWYGTSSQSKSSGRWIISAATAKPIRGHRSDVRFEKAARMDGPGL